jgi:hypothetical protein
MRFIPRKFPFKTIQKSRIFLPVRQQTLKYGHAGLMFLHPIRFTSDHFFRLTLQMKKATRRSDKTFRKS